MRACAVCGSTGFRVRADHDTGKSVFTCLDCGAVEASAIEATSSEDAANEGVQTAARHVAPPKVPLAPVATAAEPINVLRLARQRLRVVERELKVRAKLEAERDELKRLIDAATRKPAHVRSIRTAV